MTLTKNQAGEPPHPIPSNNQKIDSLQILRGLAALIVLLYHCRFLATAKLGAPASFWSVFQFGQSGVHLFFVLSGFVIFYVHEKDLGKPARLRPYILKRAIRIYPVYWILTLAVLPALFLVPDAGRASKYTLAYLLKSFTLFPMEAPPVIPPGWSLTHELKFYCWMALAIYFPFRFWRWIIGALAALSFAFLLLAIFQVRSELARLTQCYPVMFLLHPFNLQFMAGMLCAYILRRQAVRHGGMICGIGLVLFAVTALVDNRNLLSPPLQILYYGVSSTVLLFGAAAWNGQSSAPVFRYFVFLGEASYSLYLIHFPACTIACILMRKLGIIQVVGVYTAALLMVAAAVVSACLFHSWVEKPVLNAAHKRWLKPREEPPESRSA